MHLISYIKFIERKVDERERKKERERERERSGQISDDNPQEGPDKRN